VKDLFNVAPTDADQVEVKVVGSGHEDVPTPKFTIIGEPTDMVPMYMHKGYVYFSVHVEAERSKKKKGGVHSSNPDSAPSVTKTGLVEVLSALNNLEIYLKTLKNPRFQMSFPTLNVGVLTSAKGSAKNVLAAGVEMLCDARPTPDQTPEQLFGVIRDTVERAVQHLPKISARVKYERAPTPPMETSIDSEVVRMAVELTGNEPSIVSFNTEGTIFNRQGSQSVIFGPGCIEQAHTEDEYAEERYFQPGVVAIYEQFIRNMCC